MTQAPASQTETRSRPHESHDGSIRETLEQIVIAFVLAFIFRAFVVEAFIIPTGSMAPTLLGQHSRLMCGQCGYRFTVGPGRGSRTRCPMCDWEIQTEGAGPDSGDRILVLKYVYRFSEPRRWDVVVFKNPSQPDINYIKRLVGLPGEQLWVVGGNVYTRPLAPGEFPPDASVTWNIQRKPERVQRVVWQPIYHSDYQPLDGGEGKFRTRTWTLPWQAQGGAAESWSRDRNGLRWTFSGKDPAATGELRFQFTKGKDQRSLYYYNRYAYNQLVDPAPQDTVQEMRIAATVTPLGEGLRLTLTGSGADLLLRGVIEPDGGAVIQTLDRSAKNPDPTERAGRGQVEWKTVSKGAAAPLPTGRPTRVEFWHVDQSVSLWVGGRRVVYWSYDRDPNPMADGPEELPPPVARIAVQGGAAQLRSIDLDRDLYYTQGGRLAVDHHPATIQKDRFFCMGDNSPQSSDGRLWNDVDAWVSQLTGVPTGFVPRELMIGRAFFVYWPAMWPMQKGGMRIVPDFGQMRFIR